MCTWLKNKLHDEWLYNENKLSFKMVGQTLCWNKVYHWFCISILYWWKNRFERCGKKVNVVTAIPFTRRHVGFHFLTMVMVTVRSTQRNLDSRPKCSVECQSMAKLVSKKRNFDRSRQCLIGHHLTLQQFLGPSPG